MNFVFVRQFIDSTSTPLYYTIDHSAGGKHFHPSLLGGGACCIEKEEESLPGMMAVQPGVAGVQVFGLWAEPECCREVLSINWEFLLSLY